MTDFCTIWSGLVSDSPDPKVVAEAKEKLAELVEHADECKRCVFTDASVIDRLGDVYSQLSSGELDKLDSDEVARLAELDHADKAVDDEVRRAVEDTLLPDLPAPLADEVKGVDALVLFRVLDAISMLFQRFLSRESVADAQFSLEGLKTSDGKILIPPKTVIWEISRLSGLPANEAEKMLAWSIRACRSKGNVLPAYFSSPKSIAAVELRPREDDDDLFVVWGESASSASREVPVASAVAAPRAEGVGPKDVVLVLLLIAVSTLGTLLYAKTSEIRSLEQQKENLKGRAERAEKSLVEEGARVFASALRTELGSELGSERTRIADAVAVRLQSGEPRTADETLALCKAIRSDLEQLSFSRPSRGRYQAHVHAVGSYALPALDYLAARSEGEARFALRGVMEQLGPLADQMERGGAERWLDSQVRSEGLDLMRRVDQLMPRFRESEPATYFVLLVVRDTVGQLCREG